MVEYTDLVVGAIGGRGNVVLVAQSLGGFTALLVAFSGPGRVAGLRERDDPPAR